jgi:CRISPR-associated endoribonuclease Cas6
VQQLNSLKLVLKPLSSPDSTSRTSSMGPYLQGALMERVDTEYAAQLHQMPFNPYSQYCYWQGGNLIWNVNTLSNEAAAHIIEPMRCIDTINVKSAHADFEVTQTSLDTLSLKTLLNSVNESSETRVRVRFLTPTAFKSQGSYVIIPSIRLIFQNLLMHYGQVYENDKEGYAETIEYINQHSNILSYNLHSHYFDNISKGQKRIPAFMGTMTLGLRGNTMTTGLARMLLKFGEYAGVGIKTSMGMGGIQCL